MFTHETPSLIRLIQTFNSGTFTTISCNQLYGRSQDVVPLADRIAVSRLRNCVASLAAGDVMLWDTSLTYAYEASLKFQPQDMLRPEVMAEVADLTKDQIRMEMMEH